MDPGVEDQLTVDGVVEPRIVVGEYHFRVGKLRTQVVVKLYKRPGDGKVYYMLSHHIRTPSQAAPYRPPDPCADDESLALSHAVTYSLVSRYDDAIGEGHTPDESWLVPNQDFR